MTLELEPTTDILAELGAKKGQPYRRRLCRRDQ